MLGRMNRWCRRAGTATTEYALLISAVAAGSLLAWRGLGVWVQALVQWAVEVHPRP